jgi:hypothetical protein
MLNLFSIIYYKKLTITDDTEFFDKKEDIFEIKEKLKISQQLLPILYNLYIKKCTKYQFEIRENLTNLIKELYYRNTIQNYCPKDHFFIKEIETMNFNLISGNDLKNLKINENIEIDNNVDVEENLDELLLEAENYNIRDERYKSMRESMLEKSKKRMKKTDEKIEIMKNIIINIPFIIPFEIRYELFQNFIKTERELYEENYISPFWIRREYSFFFFIKNKNSI